MQEFLRWLGRVKNHRAKPSETVLKLCCSSVQAYLLRLDEFTGTSEPDTPDPAGLLFVHWLSELRRLCPGNGFSSSADSFPSSEMITKMDRPSRIALLKEPWLIPSFSAVPACRFAAYSARGIRFTGVTPLFRYLNSAGGIF